MAGNLRAAQNCPCEEWEPLDMGNPFPVVSAYEPFSASPGAGKRETAASAVRTRKVKLS